MCGIVGVYNFDGSPVSSRILKTMSDASIHRGPDGDGSYVSGAVGFAHRRLAIIDLTPAGDQPMQTADGRFVLNYNGEVYNYPELRVELRALGHVMTSRSDTEVVLHAFAQWGLEAVDRLNGMFALSLWDARERKLHLIRDRYGIKPLYYAEFGSSLLFSSEVKSILAHPNARVELDKEGLLEYLTFQNFFTDRTLFGGIKLLPPGSILTIRSDGGKEVRRFWDFNFREPENRMAKQDYVEELERLFRQAVSRQLVSDVEIGSYLSGGMDSGSISAVAASQIPDLKSFTIGFDMHSASGMEANFDERGRAEWMSYLLKTRHYEMVLKAGDMERVLPSLIWHLEEPRVGQSYPNFYAAELAGKFVKVVLSGAGGDELFGGYPWRYYRAAVNSDFEDYVDKYYLFWQRLVQNKRLRRVLKPIWSDVEHVWTRDILRDVFQTPPEEVSRPEDYINNSLYFEARTFLHGLLVLEDKLSMAHSLETRVPFLDNDLVDFAQTVPVDLKLGNLGEIVRLNENEPGPKTEKFFRSTHDGKLILREMMRRYVPEEIAGGEKQGFSAPDATWFRGESIDYVRRILLDPKSPIFEFLDHREVVDLVDEHLSGKENRRLLIWSLLSVDQWCRSFLLGQGKESLGERATRNEPSF